MGSEREVTGRCLQLSSVTGHDTVSSDEAAFQAHALKEALCYMTFGKCWLLSLIGQLVSPLSPCVLLCVPGVGGSGHCEAGQDDAG